MNNSRNGLSTSLLRVNLSVFFDKLHHLVPSFALVDQKLIEVRLKLAESSAELRRRHDVEGPLMMVCFRDLLKPQVECAFAVHCASLGSSHLEHSESEAREMSENK